MTANRKGLRSGGFSLVEMVFVIGGVSLILGMCATLMHGMLRIDRAGRRSIEETGRLARLARQFREDVRAGETAKAAMGPDGMAGLELTGPGGRMVAYRAGRDALTRVESEGGKAKAQEKYDASGLEPFAFVVVGRRVRLDMGRKIEGRTAPAIDRLAIRVEALLDKDRGVPDETKGGRP